MNALETQVKCDASNMKQALQRFLEAVPQYRQLLYACRDVILQHFGNTLVVLQQSRLYLIVISWARVVCLIHRTKPQEPQTLRVDQKILIKGWLKATFPGNI